MKHFKKIGKVLYLKASFETISRRLKNVRGRGVVLGRRADAEGIV